MYIVLKLYIKNNCLCGVGVNDDYDDNDDDGQTTDGLPKYSFLFEKKYLSVNILL